MNDALNAAILAAHHRGDIDALAQMYWQAGRDHEAANDIDQACFFLTHAYIFALEAGSPDASAIADALRKYGRL